VRKKAPRKKQRRKPQQRSAHGRSRKRSRSPPPSHGEEDGEAESEEEGMFHEPNKPQRSAPRSRSRHSRSLHGKLPSSEQPATQGQIAVLQGQVTALLNDIQPGVGQQHMAPDGRMHAHAELQSGTYPLQRAEQPAFIPQPQLPMFQTPPFMFQAQQQPAAPPFMFQAQQQPVFMMPSQQQPPRSACYSVYFIPKSDSPYGS